MTIAIITDVKALNKAISGVKSSGKAFEAKLHSVAYSCLVRVEDHGDIRPLAALYAALGGRVLKSALVAWANAFGKVTMTEATGEAEFSVKFAKGKESNLPAAFETPVSDYKPEVSGKGSIFELAAKLRSTIKSATKEGVTLSADETRALTLVENALAMLDPEFKPTSNVVQMPKAKRAKAPKAEQIAA